MQITHPFCYPLNFRIILTHPRTVEGSHFESDSCFPLGFFSTGFPFTTELLCVHIYVYVA